MTKILIIGNGFDLDLGLKTSYKDFLASGEFKELASNLVSQLTPQPTFFKPFNPLAAYLNFKSELENWVDVEHELKNYAKALDQGSSSQEFDIGFLTFCQKNHSTELNIILPKQINKPPENFEMIRDNPSALNFKSALKTKFESIFEENFIALKAALRNYLIGAEKTFKDKHFKNELPKRIDTTNAFRFLKFGYLFNKKGYIDTNFAKERVNFDINKDKDEIFTLNYTDPLKIIEFSQYSGIDPVFIHGSLENDNLVFGVEYGSVPERFNFLLKANHYAFEQAPSLLSIVKGKPCELHFFGCSFGDTDDTHFKPLFEYLTTNEPPHSQYQHQLHFYVYGTDGYRDVFNRINVLTGQRPSLFKINNAVHFYDVKKNSVIDQNYLNNLSQPSQ